MASAKGIHQRNDVTYGLPSSPFLLPFPLTLHDQNHFSIGLLGEKKKGHSVSFIPSFPPVLISMSQIYCLYNSSTKGQDNFIRMDYSLLLHPPGPDLGCKVSNKLLSEGLARM